MTEISYAEIHPDEMIVCIKYDGKELDMFIDDFDTMCQEYVEKMYGGEE